VCSSDLDRQQLPLKRRGVPE